jgi:hypothetical protein
MASEIRHISMSYLIKTDSGYILIDTGTPPFAAFSKKAS